MVNNEEQPAYHIPRSRRPVNLWRFGLVLGINLLLLGYSILLVKVMLEDFSVYGKQRFLAIYRFDGYAVLLIPVLLSGVIPLFLDMRTLLTKQSHNPSRHYHRHFVLWFILIITFFVLMCSQYGTRVSYGGLIDVFFP